MADPPRCTYCGYSAGHAERCAIPDVPAGQNHLHIWRAHPHPTRPLTLETCIRCGQPNWTDLDGMMQQTVRAALRVFTRRARKIMGLPEPPAPSSTIGA